VPPRCSKGHIGIFTDNGWGSCRTIDYPALIEHAVRGDEPHDVVGQYLRFADREQADSYARREVTIEDRRPSIPDEATECRPAQKESHAKGESSLHEAEAQEHNGGCH
jgi:hypothetical protein